MRVYPKCVARGKVSTKRVLSSKGTPLARELCPLLGCGCHMKSMRSSVKTIAISCSMELLNNVQLSSSE